MSKRKLLLADDSVTIQKVVNLTFADEGIEVVTAGDGNAAIDHINAGLPDIILADINMPGTNGYQLCEMIRNNEQTASIPVILLVGSFEPFDANEAARVGASSVLTKPFASIRALVDKVFELLDAAVVEDPEVHETYAQTETISEPAVSSEPDDIQDLYHQSLSGTEPDERETIEFVDAGMDDEMVETEYLQDGSAASDQTVEETGSPVNEVPVVQAEDHLNFDTEERRYVTDDHVPVLDNPAPLGEVTQEFETFDEFNEDEDDDVEEFENTINNYRQIHERPAEPETSGPDNQHQIYETPAANFEQTAELEPPQTGSEVQPAYAETSHSEADGFAEQLGYGEPAEAEASEQPSSYDETYQPGSTNAVEPVANNVSGDYAFEEIELLELPKPHDGAMNLVTSSEAIAQNSMQRAVSLSPELIDMIVERVVERLRREG